MLLTQLSSLASIMSECKHSDAILGFGKGSKNNMVKPHGKLVPVCCICYQTYTAGLSTWYSPRFL